VQPFVDSDHFVHSYFPAREYAIIIPGIAIAALVSFVLVFVGFVMVRSSQVKAKPKSKTSWDEVCDKP
jgi:dolichyl-phosphate mannosyltransferase polypeptide 2 regulatory subunit